MHKKRSAQKTQVCISRLFAPQMSGVVCSRAVDDFRPFTPYVVCVCPFTPYVVYVFALAPYFVCVCL